MIRNLTLNCRLMGLQLLKILFDHEEFLTNHVERPIFVVSAMFSMLHVFSGGFAVLKKVKPMNFFNEHENWWHNSYCGLHN